MENIIYKMDDNNPYAYEITDNNGMKLTKFVDEDNNLTSINFAYLNIKDNDKKIANLFVDNQSIVASFSENNHIESNKEWDGNEELFSFENVDNSIKTIHYQKNKDKNIMSRHIMYPNEDAYSESQEVYYKDDNRFSSGEMIVSAAECYDKTKELLCSDEISNLISTVLNFADAKSNEIFNEEFINDGVLNKFIIQIENLQNKTR